MAYQPPTCECGKPLRAITTIFELSTGIRKDGRMPRVRNVNPNAGYTFMLRCVDSYYVSGIRCQNRYHVEKDSRGRLLRGERWGSDEMEADNETGRTRG